jgi:prephenate dehydratase
MSVSIDSAWRRTLTTLTTLSPAAPVTRPRVAFQGERGAYGDLAIAQLWGEEAALPVASWSFEDVVTAVLRGKCDYGILPVENTVVGRIGMVCDLLEGLHGLAVMGETVVAVRHALLAPPGATLEGLRSVTSHPVALAQCQRFLERHPQLLQYDSYDTAGAARDVAARARTDEGAIAGIPAARRYHLHVLAEDIQDVPGNETRFVAVARTAGRSTTRIPNNEGETR